MEHTLGVGPLPFPDEHFDGMLVSHVVEHFAAIPSVAMLTECRRVLKPDGVLVVSVPDAEFFLEHLDDDTRENAERIFGEPIHDPTRQTFSDYALFYEQHQQVLTYASLKALLFQAGFHQPWWRLNFECQPRDEIELEIRKLINRWPFSCVVKTFK